MNHRPGFEGQLAVITGGASGLGLAAAHALADQGAQMVLWDRDRVALQAAAAELAPVGPVTTRLLDVTDPDDTQRAANEAAALTGRIDILITCAGITGPVETTWDYPLVEWNRVMRINLDGVYHACRSIAPIMRADGYGRIINVASIAGKEGNARAPAYAASKGAVIALTKALGKELVGANVVANCVCPAAIETKILLQMPPEFVADLKSKIPMERLGRAEEVAGLILYLASPACSFSTGAVFDCSGGRATY